MLYSIDLNGTLIERANALHKAGLPFAFSISQLLTMHTGKRPQVERLGNFATIVTAGNTTIKCYRAAPDVDWFCFDVVTQKVATGSPNTLQTAVAV